MKTNFAYLFPLLSLFSAARANFDIYEVAISNSLTPPLYGWVITDAEPSCDEVKNAELRADKDDVSGNKKGFRCKGDCSETGYPSDITELEMNLGAYHFTLYSDRNWDLDTTKGESQGHCYPFPDAEKKCRDGVGEILAFRKFRCDHTDYTASTFQ
ncbi:hypothetical protein ANO14919_041120 [Xylariales sp. No.14919]|nr:hypothetical protein ANO14919_041120 [Xylariales sp. No.14919]